jgi:HD-like signal output (HDOD) protein/CheY-like chemotaxis protein
MSYFKCRALVVDDEALVRNLTIRALHAEGFSCDAARDGVEAQEMLDSNDYEVVVTDLRMPNRHGHSLAVELLASDDHPIVVVLTGLMEPKLAKDLIKRGAESVEFKPVNYDLFAAKLKALAERRATQLDGRRDLASAPCPGTGRHLETGNGGKGTDSTDDAPDWERDLERLSKVLPVSQAAFDVFNMASSNDFETEHIAAAIKRDASLAADVLKLANCSFYNASGTKVVELEQAVVRIGQRRIGELALATSTLATLTASVLPWMNIDLAWRRSIAAGVAIELLLEKGTYPATEEALFLSALMHSLGRIALGMLYPQRYQEMVRLCEEQHKTLREEEEAAFRTAHPQVMARLLQSWEIPTAIYEPLKYVGDRYLSLGRVPQPLRTKAELVKVAGLIGRIAVGQWEAWDRVELPPESVLERLSIDSCSDIIEQTRSDSDAIAAMRLQRTPPEERTEGRNGPKRPSYRLNYCNLSPEPFDFLAEIIPSMGITLKACDTDVFESQENVLINSTRTSPPRLAALINPRFSTGKKLIVTDADNVEPYTRFGRVLSLPGSYGALRSACQDIAQDLRPKARAATT